MSIEEKYDEVRQLINIGKEKGYLLYDEVNELLPSEITSSDELDDEDMEGLAGRHILEMARTLHDEPEDRLPSTLLQRLSTGNAQIVTSIAATSISTAPPAACARALKRLRWERERAAIQREIDRLQELGATQHGREIDNLWQRKKNLLHRIEDLT